MLILYSKFEQLIFQWETNTHLYHTLDKIYVMVYTYVCMYVCMYICMYVCVYVCVYVYIYI